MGLWLARILGFLSASAGARAAFAATPSAPAAGEGGILAGIARLIELGGPVVPVQLLVSVIALAIILAKLVQFVRARVFTAAFVTPVARMLREGDMAGAAARLADERGPVAAVMRAAAAGRASGTPDAVVREEVERIAQAEIDSLERGLPQLSLIATISPLLGLLGTVTGLVNAFQQLAAAGDRVDPAILSSGIWEALLTTVIGLVIAIPAAVCFGLFQRAVDLVGRRAEDAATQVFTADLYRRPGLGAEGAAEVPPPAPTRAADARLEAAK
ncbi:MotA/TolQ/ExbB proton channel family protein [Thermaurantiacus sp.]